MLDPGVPGVKQSSGVVIFYALLYFAFNPCIVELYTQTSGYKLTVSNVLAYDGFHM